MDRHTWFLQVYTVKSLLRVQIFSYMAHKVVKNLTFVDVGDIGALITSMKRQEHVLSLIAQMWCLSPCYDQKDSTIFYHLSVLTN